MSEQPESVQSFCTRIEEDCEKEVAEILERAEFTARGRAEGIVKDADARRKTILEQAKEDAEAARKLVLSDLALELRKVEIRMRGEIVEEAMDMLKQRLSEFRSSPGYPVFLIDLALEGIGVLAENEVTLRPGELDREFFNEKLVLEVKKRASDLLGEEISVSIDTKPISGQAGLHVVSATGTVIFDNTIESVLDRRGDDLRLMIARNIFG
jgi:vacuolar-type H+-ATPase subunit E/Vma4